LRDLVENFSFTLAAKDIRSFAETVKFTRRVAQQEPFKSIFKGMYLVIPVMSA
jgi:hypothetical protein